MIRPLACLCAILLCAASPSRVWYPASIELDMRAQHAAGVPIDEWEWHEDINYPEITSPGEMTKQLVQHELWNRRPGNRLICGIWLYPYSFELNGAQWLAIQAGLDPACSDDPEVICNYIVEGSK